MVRTFIYRGGGYTVKVAYECEDNQSLQVFANAGNLSHIKANIVTLSKNQTLLSYDFEVKEDIENLEIVIKYNGKGAFRIKDISIRENNNIFKRRLMYIFLFMIVFDLGYVFHKQNHYNKTLVLAVLCVAFFASAPLFYKGMYVGHDGIFHRMRIEGILEELRNGNFPVRMQSLWMEGYGYPVSIYYGDLLLYIPAFFRYMGFPITQCFKCYILLINLGTSIISFWSFKKIFKRANISFILTFVYVTASYRMENVYIRNAVGEFTAMMFFPMVVAAVYGIYTETIDNWKLYQKNALLLAGGMAGMTVSHILSTEMVCFVLMLLCLLFMKKTFRKNTIRVYCLAVIQTVLFSFYFLLPFIDYYKNVSVNINNTVDTVKKIQGNGIYLVQYLSFWQNVSGSHRSDVEERFQMTPGIILMMALYLAIVLWYQGKANRKIKILVSLSIGILLMASDLFPWNFIAQETFIGNIMAQIQFPWRYLGIAVIVMTLLLGELLIIMPQKRLGDLGRGISLYVVLGGICILAVGSFSSKYCNEVGVSDYHYDTAELDNKRVMGAEYLLTGTDKESLSNEIICEDIKQVQLINRRGTCLELFCDTGEKESTIELPLYNYKGYQIMDEEGAKYNILNGTNNKIAFQLPAGFSGKITVQFVEPWYWKAAMWVSALSIIGVFMCALWEKKHKINT